MSRPKTCSIAVQPALFLLESEKLGDADMSAGSPTCVGSSVFLLSRATRISVHFHQPNGERNDGVVVDYIPNNLIPASQMTESQKQSMWWQQDDYAMFKMTARMIAYEILRRDSPYSNQNSYSSILQKIFDSCCQSPDESAALPCLFHGHDYQAMHQWLDVAVSRRGLERWSLPVVAKERQRRKQDHLSAVLRVQHEFCSPGQVPSREVADLLRRTSEQFSR